MDDGKHLRFVVHGVYKAGNVKDVASSYNHIRHIVENHGNILVLQRPLQNQIQVTERYVNRSSWYLLQSMCCKTGSNYDIVEIIQNIKKIAHVLFLQKSKGHAILWLTGGMYSKFLTALSQHIQGVPMQKSQISPSFGVFTTVRFSKKMLRKCGSM